MPCKDSWRVTLALRLRARSPDAQVAKRAMPYIAPPVAWNQGLGYVGYSGYTRKNLFLWMVSPWRVVLALLQHLRRITLQTCAATCCDMLQYNNSVSYDLWLRDNKDQHMFDDSWLRLPTLWSKQRELPTRKTTSNLTMPGYSPITSRLIPIWWRNVNDFGAVVEMERRGQNRIWQLW